MKTCKFFVLSLLALAVICQMIPLQAKESESANPIQSENYQHFLVKPDRLVVVQEGLFVDVEDMGLFRVKNMMLLETGSYSVLAMKECPAHGAYCPVCGGCKPTNTCTWRCRCIRKF